MILPFSTQLNGKQTYFVEKIWKGLRDVRYYKSIVAANKEEETKPFNIDLEIYNASLPKIHTIREDKKERWERGKLIDFFINNRTKNAYRFAPRILVVSTQYIGIYPITKEVSIDGKYLFPSEIETLAINDGFIDYYDFFSYFKDEFHGKIIHWTDFKY